jgi:hypothetical protein
MRRLATPHVVLSLITTIAFCPAGRVAVADESMPTMFQQAIGSWMTVVALLADEGEGERKESGDGRAERDRSPRGSRGEREGRGPREWSRPGERGMGSRGRPPFMRMPPTGPGMQAMRGMPMSGMRPEATARLDEIVARLSRIEQKLDAAPRMGNPWSPRPEAGSRSGAGRGERAHGAMAASPEMQDRVRDMMQEGRRRMAEAQEKMEQARKKFQEMEERIKKLEAEVERLKAPK